MGNSSSSITVQVGSTQTDNATSYIANILGCHVSYECSQNPGSCTSVKVGPSYLAVPANGSVVFVKSSTDFFVELLSDMPECDPTEIHYSPRSDSLWIVCRGQRGNIWLLNYLAVMRSGRPERQGSILKSDVISPGRGSDRLHPVFIDHRCLRPSMFIIVDNVIRHYTMPTRYMEGPVLENCSDISDVTRIGKTKLAVRCSEGVTAIYDACRGKWAYFNPNVMGRFFPCGTSFEVRYSNHSIQVFNSTNNAVCNQNYSFGEIAQVRCNEGILYAQSVAGVEYVTPLEEMGDKELFSSIERECSAGTSCSVPFLDTTGLVVLDDEKKKIMVYSTSSRCHQGLVLEERVNSIPNGIHLPVSLSSSSYHSCQCFAVATEESTTPLKTGEVTKESVTQAQPKVSTNFKIGLGVGMPTAVILLVVVIVTSICLVLWFTGYGKTVKEKLLR